MSQPLLIFAASLWRTEGAYGQAQSIETQQTPKKEVQATTVTSHHKTSTIIVALALLALYVLWGSSFAAIKIVLEAMPPFLALAIRWIVAGAILYAWAMRREGRAGERPTPAQWKSALFIGGMVIVGGIGGVAFAEQFLPSGIAALLVSTAPVWAVLISRGMLHEDVSVATGAGLVLGLVGMVLLLRPAGTEHLNPLGTGAALAAAILWAVGSVYAPRVSLPKRAVESASLQMLASGAVLLAVALAAGEFSHIRWTWRAEIALAYLTFFSSLIGFVIYIWLLEEFPITVASTVAYAAPVVAVLVGWGLLGEPITQRTLLAMGVILLGVALMITSRTQPGPRPLAHAAHRAPVPEPALLALDPACCDSP
jgi:drug/metabolite transporter (DMT)-like permease